MVKEHMVQSLRQIADKLNRDAEQILSDMDELTDIRIYISNNGWQGFGLNIEKDYITGYDGE